MRTGVSGDHNKFAFPDSFALNTRSRSPVESVGRGRTPSYLTKTQTKTDSFGKKAGLVRLFRAVAVLTARWRRVTVRIAQAFSLLSPGGLA
jgi:hypothetical protein